jgi:response regulator RpfG family c-di-GMP phosphodiesterase
MGNILIIAPPGKQRELLQQALEQLQAGYVYIAEKLDEGLERLHTLMQVDYVIITKTFAESDIAALIEQSREIRTARSRKFILVLPGSEASRAAIADSMLAGVHGFIEEPITARAVEVALQLSRNVKWRGSVARLKAAVGLKFSEALESSPHKRETDEHGHDKPRNIWAEVNQTCAEFKKMAGQSLTLAVVRPLQELSEQKKREGYTGVSKRVRKLYERKMELLQERLNVFKKGKE